MHRLIEARAGHQLYLLETGSSHSTWCLRAQLGWMAIELLGFSFPHCPMDVGVTGRHSCARFSSECWGLKKQFLYLHGNTPTSSARSDRVTVIYRNLNILNKLRNKENDVQKMVKRNSEHLSLYSTLSMQENTIYSESFLEQSRQEFKHRVC